MDAYIEAVVNPVPLDIAANTISHGVLWAVAFQHQLQPDRTSPLYAPPFRGCVQNSASPDQNVTPSFSMIVSPQMLQVIASLPDSYSTI